MRLWFLAAFVFLFSAPLLAQKEGWLPITPEEMQMKEVLATWRFRSSQNQQIKEVPGGPVAPAIQLYYAAIFGE